jgi:hypothetical protein
MASSQCEGRNGVRKVRHIFAGRLGKAGKTLVDVYCFEDCALAQCSRIFHMRALIPLGSAIFDGLLGRP